MSNTKHLDFIAAVRRGNIKGVILASQLGQVGVQSQAETHLENGIILKNPTDTEIEALVALN